MYNTYPEIILTLKNSSPIQYRYSIGSYSSKSLKMFDNLSSYNRHFLLLVSGPSLVLNLTFFKKVRLSFFLRAVKTSKVSD